MKKFSSKQFWEDRYSQGGTSGTGSYGNSAVYKADVINSLIKKYNITTINDLGHGDGNNIQLIDVPEYFGYDVSKSARDRCIHKFKDNGAYTFYSRESQFKKKDMAISLDVLYHLTEEKVYKKYLDKLFKIGKMVLIYAMDEDSTGNDHVVSRRFTPYIEKTYKDFKLIEVVNGFTVDVKFYLYNS